MSRRTTACCHTTTSASYIRGGSPTEQARPCAVGRRPRRSRLTCVALRYRWGKRRGWRWRARRRAVESMMGKSVWERCWSMVSWSEARAGVYAPAPRPSEKRTSGTVAAQFSLCQHCRADGCVVRWHPCCCAWTRSLVPSGIGRRCGSVWLCAIAAAQPCGMEDVGCCTAAAGCCTADAVLRLEHSCDESTPALSPSRHFSTRPFDFDVFSLVLSTRPEPARADPKRLRSAPHPTPMHQPESPRWHSESITKRITPRSPLLPVRPAVWRIFI